VKFKLDENIPVEISTMLRQAGLDACNVLDEALSGVTDARLFEIVQAEQRILMTLDLDFSDIRTYPPAYHAGVIVLRPKSQDLASIRQIVIRMIPLLLRETLEHRLWIVDEVRLRIRE
jgi:predicted nuclease of predicted toxin-antitoxin system